MSKPLLTHEQLTTALDYDPETGVFTNRATRGALGAGKKAGTLSQGYIRLRLFGWIYRAHQLAWLYVYGTWPKGQLDHINLVRSDNRIANLREATQAQNTANSPARRNNKCGKKGVCFAKRAGRWRAAIKKNGRTVHLGNFGSIEEAHAAYAAAARDHHGEFARAG